jgi:hypothetical protein
MLLCESGTDSCGKAGAQYADHDSYGGGLWDDRSDAYVEHKGSVLSFQYYLGLKGSFIAKVTGSHIFRLSHDWSPPSTSMPSVDFTLEGNTMRTSAGIYDRQVSATREFRYSFFLYYVDETKNSWMELIIVFPDGSSRRLDGEYGETCEVNGCRNTALTRTPDNCLPSSSRSQLPWPALSKTLEFTSARLLRSLNLAQGSRSFCFFFRYGMLTFLSTF